MQNNKRTNRRRKRKHRGGRREKHGTKRERRRRHVYTGHIGERLKIHTELPPLQQLKRRADTLLADIAVSFPLEDVLGAGIADARVTARQEDSVRLVVATDIAHLGHLATDKFELKRTEALHGETAAAPFAADSLFSARKRR